MTILLSELDLRRPDLVRPEAIGAKGCGLMVIPDPWRVPFFCLPTHVYCEWQKAVTGRRSEIIQEAAAAICNESRTWAASWPAGIILRSSATAETLNDRGSYDSRKLPADYDVQRVASAVEGIFEHYSHKGKPEPLAILIQPLISASALGHISNERRVSKTVNQWAGESDVPGMLEFRFNSQRSKPPSASHPLEAFSRSQLKSLFRQVGRWCTQIGRGPCHLEWAWDSKRLWLLQIDFEDESPDDGVNPTLLRRDVDVSPPPDQGALGLWKKADLQKETGWRKLDKVSKFLVNRDSYPSLFFMTGSEFRDHLSSGADLVKDTNSLIGGRGVCRTDTRCLSRPGINLPRTHTAPGKDIVAFMEKTLQSEVSRGSTPAETCFIMHKFIPAESAAWAWAVPGSSVVRIDSLWGVPDGLQYLPHDSYEYDVKLDKLVSERLRYKSRFIQETSDGSWQEMRVMRRKARHKCLRVADLEQIAHETWQLAKATGDPLAVMWFCGVADDAAIGRNVPWFSIKAPKHLSGDRGRVYPGYQRVAVKNLHDLEVAEKLTTGRILLVLDPETTLIRDDERFLGRVIRIAKTKGCPVEIQGSVLAHAFYQLEKEGVTTVVSDAPRSRRVRGKKVFHKLVRDSIPEKITAGGEKAITARIAKQEARAALIVKLFEEAQELKQAESPEEVTLELADLVEVVKSLASATGVSWETVIAAADNKRESRGSFQEGVVLMETSWSEWLDTDRMPQREIPLKALAEVRSDEGGSLVSYTALLCEPDGITIDLPRAGRIRLKLSAEGLSVRKTSATPNGEPQQLSLPI